MIGPGRQGRGAARRTTTRWRVGARAGGQTPDAGVASRRPGGAPARLLANPQSESVHGPTGGIKGSIALHDARSVSRGGAPAHRQVAEPVGAGVNLNLPAAVCSLGKALPRNRPRGCRAPSRSTCHISWHSARTVHGTTDEPTPLHAAAAVAVDKQKIQARGQISEWRWNQARRTSWSWWAAAAARHSAHSIHSLTLHSDARNALTPSARSAASRCPSHRQARRPLSGASGATAPHAVVQFARCSDHRLTASTASAAPAGARHTHTGLQGWLGCLSGLGDASSETNTCHRSPCSLLRPAPKGLSSCLTPPGSAASSSLRLAHVAHGPPTLPPPARRIVTRPSSWQRRVEGGAWSSGCPQAVSTTCPHSLASWNSHGRQQAECSRSRWWCTPASPVIFPLRLPQCIVPTPFERTGLRLAGVISMMRLTTCINMTRLSLL